MYISCSVLKGQNGSNISEKPSTNQNSIRQEIKSRMKSGNACYHLVQILLFSSFLSKHKKIMIRGDADKSLARSTYRCRRTESIVSLERGACPCAELQAFSCYRGGKEACQATCAISTTSRRELSSIFFPLSQGAEGNSRHSDRNIRGICTMVCHRQKLGGPV